ncbi:MAG: fasciclin domain-containing protein [Halobacteriota archaeon]
MSRAKLLILLIVTILVITPLCTIAGAQMATKIVYPHDGDSAGPTEPMSGTATTPSSGQTLRMVLYIPSVGRYYPQKEPIKINSDGSWYYRCTIGSAGDNGRQFQIHVVTADANANSAFDNYIANGQRTGEYPGMTALPAGATSLATATVTRVAQNQQQVADPPLPSASPSTTQTPTPTPIGPSSTPTPTPTPTPFRDTIAQAAQNNTNLSTLVKLLALANLNDTLSGPGNFTLLAPSNDAFAKLNNTTLADLQNNKTQLKTTLLYHVLPKKILANNFSGNGTLTTVNGLSLPYSVNGSKVIFGSGNNTATVTKADINASNGVIHVIDGVLQPSAGSSFLGTSSAASGGGFLGLPGFEAIYAVAGLLAVAYLVMRRRRKQAL